MGNKLECAAGCCNEYELKIWCDNEESVFLESTIYIVETCKYCGKGRGDCIMLPAALVGNSTRGDVEYYKIMHRTRLWHHLTVECKGKLSNISCSDYLGNQFGIFSTEDINLNGWILESIPLDEWLMYGTFKILLDITH